MRFKKLSNNTKNDIANIVILFFAMLILCLIGDMWLSIGF